jgi:heptosyltransferase-2
MTDVAIANNMGSKKFLIIQTASIGDVILATPVIEKLHSCYSDSKIDFLIKKGCDGVLSGHPLINTLYIWNKGKGKYANLYQILKEVRTVHYDYVINIQRFASTGLFTALSKGEIKSGFSKNPFSFLYDIRISHHINNGMHEIERNLELIQNFTDKSPSKVMLYPTPKDSTNVLKFKNSEYLCIAPASLWLTKQYPAGKWIEFINIIEKGLYIYLLGSESDNDLCKEIINSCNNKKVINLAGKLTLLETAALMKDSIMNFVNDSAPLHISSAMNAPTTAVFCSTVPEFGFGPLADDSVVVQTSLKLDCRPCGLHGFKKCPEKNFDCAYSVNNDELLKRIIS